MCDFRLARRVPLLILAGLLAVVAAAGGAARGSGAAAAPVPAGVSPKGIVPGTPGPYGVEVPSLRTRFSNTYSTGIGERVAVVSTAPVNYLDARNSWQPIDSSLVPSAGGGFQNAANEFALRLPANLASPVTLTRGGSSLSFALDGASGVGVATGATGVYPTGWAGVTAAFASVEEGVKETLTLASAQVPGSFSYSLDATGVTAKMDGGTLSFRDSAGTDAFVLPAAFMVDANGAVGAVDTAFTRSASGSGYTLTLTPDAAWLADPARVFPVRLDPSVSVSPSPDCTISGGGSANTNFCSATTLDVGWSGTTASRSLLKFSTGSVPADAIVLNAQLKLYLGSESTSTSTSVGVYGLTRAFTSGVTWNKYDGTNSWTTPGGDFNPAAASTNGAVGGSTGAYVSWWPTGLVQGWVDGSSANNGLLVKQTAENQTNVLHFNAQENAANKPLLVVTYQWRLGELRQYSYERQQLDDRMDLAVNVGNGNLIVHNHDLQFPGTAGHDLVVDRYFNDLSPNTWYVGNGWNLSTAKDTRIVTYGDGSLEYASGSGYELPFTFNGTSLQSPPGLDGTLLKNTGDGTYDLTWVKSGDRYHLSAPSPTNGQQGTLLTDKTKNAGTNPNPNTSTITVAYQVNGHINTITDTKGIVLTFTYTNDLLTQIADPSGRLWKYGYDAHNNLGR